MVVYLARVFNRVAASGFLLSMLLCSGLAGIFVMDACAAGGTPITSTQTNTSNVTIVPDANEIFDVLVDSDGNPVVFTNAASATLTVPSIHDVEPAYGVKISGEGSSFINDGIILHDESMSPFKQGSGIFTDANNTIIENNGTIETTGDYGFGIGNFSSANSSISLSGSGSITTSGSFGDGVHNFFSDNSTINISGDINHFRTVWQWYR